MKHLIVFLAGLIIGVLATSIYHSTMKDEENLLSSTDTSAQKLSGRESLTNSIEDTFLPMKDEEYSSTAVDSFSTHPVLEAKQLFEQLNSDVNLLNNQEIFELTYLASKSDEVADLIKRAIIENHSLQDKTVLLNLLSQNKPDDMINFGIEMLNSGDINNKKIALELIDSIKLYDNNAKISASTHQSLAYILLDSSYDESNPELLSDVIGQLTRFDLDATTKEAVSERFQHLTMSNNIAIKVKALDGLTQVADQYILQDTIKDFLFDTNEDIKLAGINAVFHLQPDLVDAEIVSTLTRIIDNEDESQSARNIAAAALNSHQ